MLCCGIASLLALALIVQTYQRSCKRNQDSLAMVKSSSGLALFKRDQDGSTYEVLSILPDSRFRDLATSLKESSRYHAVPLSKQFDYFIAVESGPMHDQIRMLSYASSTGEFGTNSSWYFAPPLFNDEVAQLNNVLASWNRTKRSKLSHQTVTDTGPVDVLTGRLR